VVDFGTVKKATLFVTTIAKILILNQLFCSLDKKMLKRTNIKVNTSDYFLYKSVGKLYETHLCFNENLSLFRAEKLAYNYLVTGMSGYWTLYIQISCFYFKKILF